MNRKKKVFRKPLFTSGKLRWWNEIAALRNGASLCGLRCDSSNCEICKNGTCVRAVPTNMCQTLVRDMGNGVLYFTYEWDSTTGNLDDIAHCEIREKVDFPGGNPYYYSSPPWAGSEENPLLFPVPGVPGNCGYAEDA